VFIDSFRALLRSECEHPRPRASILLTLDPVTRLFQPDRVWTRDEVIAAECPVPRAGGVYAWFFRDIPREVPIDNCIRWRDLTLLYVGISPSSCVSSAGVGSRQTLWNRVRYHYVGNAEGSTLRLTLGCLLERELDVKLRRVGSGRRMTFHDGEARLSQWMASNAFVTWVVSEHPEHLESELIASGKLPLNLAQNQHSFVSTLGAIRRRARERARELPIR
jgi:hypothetical protein